jgi:exodeoxyribonuclease VII large subunit
MSQLPFEHFDPQRMAKSKQPEQKARARREQARYGSIVESQQLTVSQLSRLIDETLKDHLPSPIRVVGEISGFRDRTHWYFDLKDEGAVVNCVAFATVNRRLGFVPENGMEVVVTGRVEHYPKQGKTQLYAQKIEPVGAGALELAYRQLCEELRGLGYYDPSHKQRLPTFPRRIAVVTSRSGAALQDVLDTMRRRCSAIGVVLIDARVQGEQAAGEIAAAVRRLSRVHERWGVDAILLTRGGGSMEDLWAFNERIVAEAIYECTIPVVAAIGHETDTTIAELVADERAATPTQAAMRLTPDREALTEQMSQLSRRLRRGLAAHLKHERQRLVAAARHPAFADPRARLHQAQREVRQLTLNLAGALRHGAREAGVRLHRAEQRLLANQPKRTLAALTHDLAQHEKRLAVALKHDLTARRERLRSLERQLEIAGPASVLRRGYSCTLDESGNVIRSVEQVRPGLHLTTRVADGEFTSTVDEQQGATGARAAGAPASPASADSAEAPPTDNLDDPDHPQMDLFDTVE